MTICQFFVSFLLEFIISEYTTRTTTTFAEKTTDDWSLHVFSFSRLSYFTYCQCHFNRMTFKIFQNFTFFSFSITASNFHVKSETSVVVRSNFTLKSGLKVHLSALWAKLVNVKKFWNGRNCTTHVTFSKTFQ